MKKKLLIIVTALIMVLTCAFAFVACSGDDVEGTYYVYVGGEKQEGATVELKDGKVTFTMDLGEDRTASYEGTYKVDGKNVKVTMTIEGETDTQELTYVSDGVYKYVEDDMVMYYCKDGKTPPAEEAKA